MVKHIFLSFFFFHCFTASFSQFSGNNLLETQFGKLPTDTTGNFPAVYDRAVLNYKYKRFKAGITLEQFYTPYAERTYFSIQQARLQYRSRGLEINLGSFYETLGRGTLLRSYQVQGAILEDLSFRSRHYFHRDLVGGSVHFRKKKFSAKAMYGKPLNNLFPPNQSFENRRPDNIGALSMDYNLNGQILGAALMHLDNDFDSDLYGMIHASGNLTEVISYYGEFSSGIHDFESDGDGKSKYAVYLNMNFSFDRLGISAEYKYYDNFLLGSGINEPPALIKEHVYRVLNRSTHVMQPSNERGYQVEAFYNVSDESILTFNNALAINDFGRKFVYQEYFLEYATFLNQKHDLKLFVNYAEDPFKGEKNRISFGAYAQWKIKKQSGVNSEIEVQSFKRDNGDVYNLVVFLGYSYKSKFSAGVITEASNDSFIIDSEYKIWFGTSVKYKLNPRHTFLFFAGQRRGGPACNSGVCYEVLDFEGLELRLSSRF